MIRDILLLIAMVIASYGAINSVDVTHNNRSATENMPGENSSAITLDSTTRQYIKAGFDVNSSADRTTDVYGNNYININGGESRKTIDGACVGRSGTQEINIYSYRPIKDFRKKSEALGLTIPTDAGLLFDFKRKVNASKCFNFRTDIDGDLSLCGKCARELLPKMAQMKQTRGGGLFLPSNSMLKGMFQFNGKSSKSIGMLQKMHKQNPLSSNFDISKPGNYDPTQFPSDLNNTEDVNRTRNIIRFKKELSMANVKQKVVRCYARRDMVPQYYCPINGLEAGARTGGGVNDDLKKAKEECDSYCVSAPYSCRSISTGYNKHIAESGQLRYTFSASEANQSKEFVLNTKLELQKISFTIKKYFQDNNSSYNNIPVKMKYKISYMPQNKNTYVNLTGATTLLLDSNISLISIPKIVPSKKIKLTVYPPFMENKTDYQSVHIDDVLSKVEIGNFTVDYTDDNYYFCSLDQIILDPATQCADGKAYELTSDDGIFIVCKSDNKIQGPEEKYGAFYTKDSCEQSCRIKSSCLESYANFANINSPSAYKVTVGCVDDPNNVNCSKEKCEQLFEQNKMPIEEYVYDGKKSERKTVTSGVEIPNSNRPRINMAMEKSAAQSGNQSDYDALFLEEMKDQAYKNMINRRTYDYVSVPVSQSTPFEYAYREEKESAVPSRTYTGSMKDKKIYWKLKPASFDIDGHTDYYIYKVIRSEQMFKPISGVFMNNDASATGVNVTYTPKRNYKDIVYSFVTESKNIPFYIKEYAEVYVDSNSSDVNTTGAGWVENQQHNANRYIGYDPASGRYLARSSSDAADSFETIKFDGSKNYEELFFIDGAVDYLSNKQDGGLIQTQKSAGASALPVKIYQRDQHEDGKSGAVVNYSLYGIYAKTQLKLSDVVSLLEGDNSDKYLVYRATKGSRNKKIIHGDGTVKNDRIKMFMKGGESNSTLTMDIKPRIEEEGKDVIFFMYLYEGGL